MYNFDRHNHTPYQFPTSENDVRRHLYQYPPSLFSVEPELNRTLESFFSSMHLSPYISTSANGVDFGHGSVVRNSDYDFFMGGFEGLSQSPMLAIEQNHDGFGRLGMLNNGDDNHYPIMHVSNRNGVFPALGMNDYNTAIEDSVSKNNFNGLEESGLYNRRVKQRLDQISLKDLRGRIVQLAMDQHGCRFLQTKFEGIKDEEIEIVFGEVIGHVNELMIDQFGNYLVQKLVEVCNVTERTRILVSITKTKFQLVCICLDAHGTRSVQKLMEYLTIPQQISLLMSALTPGAVKLMKDINGHHVIQHCFKRFSDEDNKYLLKEVAANCFEIATDKNGCCVLQSCMEHFQGESKERLLAEIIANAHFLTVDRYGNYVVQHLLKLKIARVTPNLIRSLEGNYFSLSCNKYGSNVVEKCLKLSGEEHSTRIIMELFRSPNISMLLLDPFGNYVIQSALAVSKGPVLNALVKLVEAHSSTLRCNIYGKKVLTCLEKKHLCNMYRNVQK